jgi:hypothetical protein
MARPTPQVLSLLALLVQTNSSKTDAAAAGAASSSSSSSSRAYKDLSFSDHSPVASGNQFTCFTGKKVQILTLRTAVRTRASDREVDLLYQILNNHQEVCVCVCVFVCVYLCIKTRRPQTAKSTFCTRFSRTTRRFDIFI